MLKNFHYLFLAILLLNFIKYTNEIFFVLDAYEQRCISKQMTSGSTFAGVYFISGEKEEGNKVTIKNPFGQDIQTLDGHKNGSFNYLIEKEGTYSLCIETTSNLQLTASFEFYDEKKDEQLISVSNINIKNVKKILKILTQLYMA